jgi:hypothetical protein
MSAAPRATGRDQATEACGGRERPGLVTDDPRCIDYSDADSTPDQQRIEDALDALSPHREQWILHVGVGNSRLAQRFAPRVAGIDGLTVSQREKDRADGLGLANYTVYVLNKYSDDLPRTILHGYDFIVDNNLASFACCSHHLDRMFDAYAACLRPGGRVVTDQGGMDWSVGDDPRWRLTFDDLVALGARFGHEVSALTGTVYAMRRLERA